MNPLQIELTKSPDRSVLLRCVRTDGSVTWQKQDDERGLFFALHDLTHFGVETVLRLNQGFYGLIASGWDIFHTTGKGSKGALPDQALAVEHLVGMLDVERASGVTSDATELNEHTSAYAEKNGLKFEVNLNEDSIHEIRSLIA